MTHREGTSARLLHSLDALRLRARLRSSCGRRAPALGILALIGAVPLLLFASSTAQASYTRPFLRQIKAVPSGPHASPFGAPGGIAVDSADHLWVGDYSSQTPPYLLDEFDSSGNYLNTLEIEGPEPLIRELEDPENHRRFTLEYGDTAPEQAAFDHSNNRFYTVGARSRTSYEPSVEVFDESGTFVRRFGTFARPHIAIDNSPESSAGTIYLAHGGQNPAPELAGDGLPPGVEKLDAEGNHVNFAEAGKRAYVYGNQIIGAPISGFEHFESNSPLAVAVDGHGHIYVAAYNGFAERVFEYSASGLFLGEFDGEETGGLEENTLFSGFGNAISSLAVDPATNHLLVGVQAFKHAAIDEFDIGMRKFLKQITETASGQPLRGAAGMAVDSQGYLYLRDWKEAEFNERAVDEWGPGRFAPTVKLGEATDRTVATATLNGTVNPEAAVNPEHSGISECEFQFVPLAQYESDKFASVTSAEEAPCNPAAGAIPADEEPHAVKGEATGLTSGTLYRYRLVAATGGALGGVAATAPLSFTAPHAPLVESTSASNVSSTFVDLRATIDPLGSPTSYQFQYLSAAAYAENGGSFEGAHLAALVPASAPSVGAGGGSGSIAAEVLQHVGGLQPATAYRFRALAVNEVGPTTGPEAVFTTLPAVEIGLPDGRAYEMLTPPNKGSAADLFAQPISLNREYENGDLGLSSESGNEFLFETPSAFGPYPGSGESAYVFTRTPSGWTYTSLAVPGLGAQTPHAVAFDPAGLSGTMGIDDFVGSAGAPSGTTLTTFTGPPGGPYTTIHADPGFHLGETGEETHIVGGSRDGGHLIIESRNQTLAPGAEGQNEGAHTLYEYANGALSAVNVTSAGKPLNHCGAVLGEGGKQNNSGNTHSAVSEDGSGVIFTSPDPYMSTHGGTGGRGCWDGGAVNPPQVYMRSGGNTIELSAPAAGVTDPTGRHPAVFAGASADASRVFFTSRAELTADDAGIHDEELYEWRSDGTGGCASPNGCLTRISAGEAGDAAAGVNWVPAVSEDGSAVYFIAPGRLTASAPGSLPPEELYLYRFDTVQEETAYIGTVDKREDPSSPAANWLNPSAYVLQPHVSWYATPNGRYLLFATTSELTAYGTYAPNRCYLPDTQGASNGHCEEVYRYDAQAPPGEQVICLSCNPTGEPPTSNAGFARSNLAETTSAVPRSLSNDGSIAVFDTADGLVPQDTNGTLDVYEWHDGRISLISSGKSSAPSYFLSMSADGANVFFGTHASLVPADTNSVGDVYDARICTAADPCIQPPSSQEGLCEGDACSHPTPVPNDATPGSLTYHGPGNERPVKAKKKRRRHKKHRHQRSHHKRGHKGRVNRTSSNRGGHR